MDTDTRTKIIEELTKYLNRPPSEREVMNAQTDINIMSKVKEKQTEEITKISDDKIKSLELEIIKLKK